MKTLSLGVISLALLAVASLLLVSGCGQLSADKVVSIGERELSVAKGPEETPKTHEVALNAEIVLDGEPAQLEDIRPGDSVKVTTEKQGEQEVAVKVEATRSQEEAGADKKSGVDEPSPRPAGKNEPSAEDDAQSPGSAQARPAPDRQDPKALPEGKEHAAILFAGVITLVGEDQIRVQGNAQSTSLPEEMVFKLTDETKISLAGKPAGKKDLVKGMEVAVTAERPGKEAVAKRIDAKPAPA